MNSPMPTVGSHSQPVEVNLELAGIEPKAFTEIWQRLVDGLSEEIGLVDEGWTILVVNKAWAKQAALYGPTLFMPGANLMQSCRERAAEGAEIAIDLLKGIQAIDAGKRTSFRMLYRATEPESDLDHELRIHRFAVGGRMYASVTRYDVTRQSELRRLKKDFSREMLLGQADERRRIGREIHDSTMQLITGLELKMAQLACSPRTGFETTLAEMRELLGETRQAIQAISFLTHPPQLDNVTLPEALEALVSGFSRRMGLDVTFEVAGEAWDAAETEVIGEVAYRIVQEALSNVQRHACAHRAVVRLIRRRLHVHVVVADDGVGMPADASSGVGLAGMRSRLAELGGRLTILPGRPGTTIIASIPAPLADQP